jgi:ATP-dependent DNA ligase
MDLPYFIPPMLAEPGQPFDSDDYVFEVKWDGYRVLLFREGDEYRLMSRNSVLLNRYYPALEFLSGLPAGTVLDGELVAFVDGKPDFESLRPGRSHPGALVAYIAFDILYKNFEQQMPLPLRERKAVLESLLRPFLQERLLLNPFVDARGILLFEDVKARGLEGVMAKRRDSLYLPGARDGAWKKIKVPREMYCVVIGYIPREHGGGFKSLMLASDIGGELRYVGRVGTGFSHKARDELFGSMKAIVAESPCVPCPERGVWLRPELYCKIGYTDFTQAGMLREPVFKSLVR